MESRGSEGMHSSTREPMGSSGHIRPAGGAYRGDGMISHDGRSNDNLFTPTGGLFVCVCFVIWSFKKPGTFCSLVGEQSNSNHNGMRGYSDRSNNK